MTRPHVTTWPVGLGIVATIAGAVSFAVCFVIGASNAWLGGSLALALLGLGLALAYWGRDLADDQVIAGRYPVPPDDPEGGAALATQLDEHASVITRRSFLSKALVLGIGVFALSQVVLLGALGPLPGDSLRTTGWRKGRRLVDSEGEPVTRDVLASGGFLVAFPEGSDQKADSQIVLLHFVNGEFTPAARARDVEPRGLRRLLARLHPRRLLRGPVRRRGPAAAVPVPPVDVRRPQRRRAHQRPGEPPAAAAAAGHRRRGRAVRAERLHRAHRPRLLERVMKKSDHDLKRGLGKAFGVRTSPLRPAGRWLHTNLGGSRLLREELRHIFPDSWAFFLGEIAMYCFIILVATGIFLALFFQASEAPVIYEGSYEPLAGAEMSIAYDSVLQLSLDVPAGLLMRQLHHWAALVFVGALIIHMIRMFVTAAYRRPRRINWLIGLSLVLLVGMNGLMGYSLPDDLLSGTGLRISFAITESIPFVGPALATLLFGGEFPSGGLIARVYPVHIFLLPAAIGGLLGAHLGLLWLQRHTQFPGPGRSDRVIVGTPMVPAYALRTTGYLLLVAGVCTAFAAFVQINPVWLYGPYRAWDATTAAQPDWYMGWLEGGVRMMPGWDIQIGGLLIPALFWPAVVLPGLIFTPLFLVPWIDWVANRDGAFHNVLLLPGQHPARTALAAGFITFLSLLLVAGGNDVFAFAYGWSQPWLLEVLQWLTIVLPPVVAVVTYALLRGGARRWASTVR